MDDPFLYHTDIYAWSKHQAALLRGLARGRHLPNELDLEHVAEEIEDLGGSQLSSVQSYVRLILVHILKAASVESVALRSYWHGEVGRFQNELLSRFSKAMRENIDLELLWRRAFKEAELKLRSYEQHIRPVSHHPCPLTLDELLADEFDFEAIVARVEQLDPENT